MRALYLLLLLGIASGSALAQTSSQNVPQGTADKREALSEPEQAAGRSNQRTERIHIEDAGSRVDELRVGGQTKSITVKPKSAEGNIPEYEVIPNNGIRDGGPSKAGADSFQAPRVWTLRKF